jgi:hypothetical protein
MLKTREITLRGAQATLGSSVLISCARRELALILGLALGLVFEAGDVFKPQQGCQVSIA